MRVFLTQKKHANLNSGLRVAITLHQQTKNQIIFLLNKNTQKKSMKEIYQIKYSFTLFNCLL